VSLLEEHADVRYQAVLILLEQQAFGPRGRCAVDLKGFGQLDERDAAVDVRDALDVQSVAFECGANFAQVGDVMLLALNDVAERTLSNQAGVGDGGGQAIPIVGGEKLQVLLDHPARLRVHGNHSKTTQRTREQARLVP
jgi:hypothetical protein